MTIKEKKALYERIMRNVSKNVKKTLNESFEPRSVSDDGNDFLTERLGGNAPMAERFAAMINAATDGWGFECAEDIENYDDYYYDLADMANESDGWYSAYYNVVDYFLNRGDGSATIAGRINDLVRKYLSIVF